MASNQKIQGNRPCLKFDFTYEYTCMKLISLDLLKRWDLIHESFPFQTVSDYIYSTRDIYTGKEIETFPAHKSELKKLFPHSYIKLIIV